MLRIGVAESTVATLVMVNDQGPISLVSRQLKCGVGSLGRLACPDPSLFKSLGVDGEYLVADCCVKTSGLHFEI